MKEIPWVPGKPPAFQLYAADFYMDVLTWGTDEIGTYFCLLMAEWVNGPLDADTRKLAKIAKKTHQKFIKNWPKISHKFVSNGDGKLINLRLEETRRVQIEYREKQAMAGRKGGLTTQEKKREQSSEPLSDASSDASSKPSSEIEALQSSSSSLKKILLCPHQEIVQTYNHILGHLLTPVKFELWHGSQREKYLQARWKENEKYQTIEFWKGLFEYVRDKCPFLIGAGNGTWKADLRWIVKRDNFIKIVEGNYEK